MSEAKYFRFWRGEIKTDLPYVEFQNGLNTLFVPATGALAQTPARLVSYQPVLLSQSLTQRYNLPTEIALVEYESEQTYQNFRSTPAGQHYSRMHWDYFDQQKSRSLVALKYNSTLELNRAYWHSLKNDFSVASLYSFIKIYSREKPISAGRWLDGVTQHLERVSAQNPEALIFLVDEDYVMEYSLWSTGADRFDPHFEAVSQLVLNSQLFEGRILEPDTGIKFK